MKDDNAFLRKVRWDEVLVAPLIGLIMSVGLFFWNPFAGVAGLVGTIFLIFHSITQEHETQNRITHAIESLDGGFDEVTKSAVFGMPFPMTVLNGEGNFLWYNSFFKEIFKIESSLLGKPYDTLFPDIAKEALTHANERAFRIRMDERIYLFYNSVTTLRTGEDLILLYGVDNTEDEDVRARYLEEKPAFAVVCLDNYDEVRASRKETSRPLVFAQIDGKINEFADTYESSIVKYDSDRYLLVMTQASLEAMKADKFTLLEQVKRTTDESSIHPTVSIGVGYGLVTPSEMLQEARAALDIALARGGDQAVLKSGENLDYYGGKNQATQRFTKVKARVMSNTLRAFIEESTNVLIMGHQNPDMDSLGSSLGMLQFVEGFHGEGYIVLDDVPAAIENLYAKARKEIPNLAEKILFTDQSHDYLQPGTLLIVLDNHRKNAVADPSLLDGSHRVIIIDHHRRGAGYIEGAEISYIEPSASSTSEMVTELISYQENDVTLPKVVAEGLLAGITVDTKNFFYQTGTRTFEAAAYLKQEGADSIVIKELFKDDFELMRYRAEILSRAQHYTDSIMISRFEHDVEGSTLIASQAADDLMGIRNVQASFVLTLSHGKVHISARSLGDISVQLILEKIGGGGHLTAAATQLAMNMEEAESKLKMAIDEYLKEVEDESNPA